MNIKAIKKEIQRIEYRRFHSLKKGWIIEVAEGIGKQGIPVGTVYYIYDEDGVYIGEIDTLNQPVRKTNTFTQLKANK